MRQFTFGLIFLLNGTLSLQSLCGADVETLPRVTYEPSHSGYEPACPLGFRGYRGPGLMDLIGNFSSATDAVAGCSSAQKAGSCARHGEGTSIRFLRSIRITGPAFIVNK